jgi:hypothetical protein
MKTGVFWDVLQRCLLLPSSGRYPAMEAVDSAVVGRFYKFILLCLLHQEKRAAMFNTT